MTFRTLLARAARPLPARAQVMLKEVRAAVQDDDWAGPVARLRRDEQVFLDQTARRNRCLPGRMRILVFAPQQSPPWLDVSYGLAAALRLRGHDVSGVLCDGMFPLCEMNLGPKDRPPCEVCVGWLGRHADAFGFDFQRLSHLLDSTDRDDVERVVAATDREDLRGLIAGGVPVGRLAARELQRYRRGFVFDPSIDEAYRPWIASGILTVRLSERLLDEERPDIVVTSSGRTLLSACLRKVAEARGIRVVSWDTEPARPDGLILSHGSAASERPLNEAWEQAQRQPLSSAQTADLTEYIDRWKAGEGAPIHRDAPVRDAGTIRESLALGEDLPLVVAFTNTAWDMKVVDRDLGFDNMFDWLFALVEYAAAHPEIGLVVRAHPAETRGTPDLHSRTPVVPEVRRRFGELPRNVALVGPDNPIDSYALADMASVVTVYSSRIGLEVALTGKRAWVAGDVTYRAKGFTRDLESKAAMVQWLDRRPWNEQLSADECDLAARFAYLWFFRYVVRLPLLRPPDRRLALRSFRDLAPGGDPVLDRLCDALVTGAPFVDLHA